MLEFFQAYGSWILFGLLFLFMLRMHGGGGCGMGHRQPTDEGIRKTNDGVADAKVDNRQTGGTAAPKGRSGGCH